MASATLKNSVMPDSERSLYNCQGSMGRITKKPGRAFIWLCLAILFIPILLFVGTSCMTGSQNFQLVVAAPELNEELLRVEVEPEDRFILIYIHSVTGREVKGTFQVTGEGFLLPLITEFDAFGPGLPELDSSQTYNVINGIITVYHNEEPRERIGLFVSPLTKERMLLFDQEYDLTSRQESPRLIHIYIATGAD